MAGKKKLPPMVFSTSPASTLPPYSFTTNPPRAQLPGFSVTPQGPVANVAPVAPPPSGVLPGFSVQPTVPTKTATPIAPPLPNKLVNVPTKPAPVKNTARGFDPETQKYTPANLDDLTAIKFDFSIPKRNKEAWSRKAREELDKVMEYVTNNPRSGIAQTYRQSDDTALRGAWGRTDNEATQNIRAVGALRRFQALVETGINSQYADRLSPHYNKIVTRYEIGGGRDFRDVARAINTMSQTEFDTFASLVPEWDGTVNQLIDTARELSK